MTVGGGIVSEPETYNLLLLNCFTVWVKASPDEHMARVVAQGDFRPMQGNAEAMDDLNRILDAREPLYRKADVDARHVGRDVPTQSLAKLREAVARLNAITHQETAMGEAAASSRRVRRRKPATSPTTRIPTATRTGSSRSTGRSRRSRSASTRTAASARLQAEAQLVRPRRRHRARRRAAAHPLRASGSAQRRRHQSAASASSARAPTSSCSGSRSHAWKVNFCKFTNETRNGIEDSSRHSGLKFVAACNGTTAGGGYELALACDEILLIDDRSSAVSLPEVPLLGVLPGTGGLTRVTDKRRVRRDHADIFCTLVEGVRAPRAKEWRLIDDHAKPQQFAAKVKERALALAGAERPAGRARRASR